MLKQFVEFCALSDCDVFVGQQVPSRCISLLLNSVCCFDGDGDLFGWWKNFTATTCLQNSGSCDTAVLSPCNSTARLPVSRTSQGGCCINLQRRTLPVKGTASVRVILRQNRQIQNRLGGRIRNLTSLIGPQRIMLLINNPWPCLNLIRYGDVTNKCV